MLSPISIPLSNDPVVALHNGTEFFRVGAYPDAVRQLEHCLKLDPDNVRARYHLALAYFRLGQDFQAIHEYNQVACSTDTEAQLATHMLQRAFQLSDGDPLTDVHALSLEEAERVSELMDHPILQPIRFACIIWADKWGGEYQERADLSIILGPGQRYYCTLPPDQAPLIIDEDPAWVPVWSCSASVFDRIGAQQLFFQRALLYWRHGCHYPDPPIYVQCTTFSRAICDILLHRVYDGNDTVEEEAHPWLFPNLPWVPEDFGL